MASKFTASAAARLLWALGTFVALAAQAQDPSAALLTPPVALLNENVPPVSVALQADVTRYTEFKPTSFTAWHSKKREMLVVRRHLNTPQIFALSAPGAALSLRTDYVEPVRGASIQPKGGEAMIFTKDTGGNEVFRLYRSDSLDTKGIAVAKPITPEDRRVNGSAWAKAGDKIAYLTVPLNRSGATDGIQTDLFVGDPKAMEADPKAARLLATLPGGGWGGLSFSFDDKRLVLVEYVSANESKIWLMDIATGKREQFIEAGLEGKTDEKVSYGGVRFSRDGKGLYAESDRDSEFKRLVYIDLKTRISRVLSGNINWDIQSFSVSKDGKLIAIVSNEDGVDVLHLLRPADMKWLPTPKLPNGSIGGLSWFKDTDTLALTVSSAKAPSDVFSYSVKSGKMERWTTHEAVGVDPAKFVEAEVARWKSFDGRMISGLVYRAPAAKYPGKRPVVINIHGGPESQAQAGFGGRNNYYGNEMGITTIYPNVRGSSGFGKTFLKLDNGRLREDSVKDIRALFEWIAAQPDMDASRVMVTGGSYGGYMVLAIAALYPEHIAGAIDAVGISNFVTFLQNTESYRRDLRRVEYGDERDPSMRAFLQEISPLNRAEKMTKPMFIVQGKNDPRVPYTEAEQIVATLKKQNTPYWYMLADNEGHGFAKKANSDYLFYSSINFMRKYLLE
ncbi:MAG: S9 family peptidase [Rhodocyclaceae bacterium]|nr:S9 family peptidase [Rhodocyclaceae bacterium]